MVQPIEVGKFKSFADFQEENQKNSLAQALTMAQIQKAMKPDDFDVTKVGQAALVKKQMGLPTTPQEDASAQVYTAMTESVFQDFEGNIIRKPGVGTRLGDSNSRASTVAPGGNFTTNMQPITPGTGGGGNFLDDVAPANGQIQIPPELQAPLMGPSQNRVYTLADEAPAPAAPVHVNEWEQKYLKERNKFLQMNDRKSVQVLDQAWAKSQLEMNEAQSKNATAADRLDQSQPALENPDNLDAYSKLSQRALDFINPFGDNLNSSEYKQFNQARKNVSEARLRAVSGAVINPSEFENENSTLFPQVGDPPELLAQKAANREVIRKGLARAAGPAYTPAPPAPAPKVSLGAKEKSARAVATPAELAAWKKLRAKQLRAKP